MIKKDCSTKKYHVKTVVRTKLANNTKKTLKQDFLKKVKFFGTKYTYHYYSDQDSTN